MVSDFEMCVLSVEDQQRLQAVVDLYGITKVAGICWLAVGSVKGALAGKCVMGRTWKKVVRGIGVCERKAASNKGINR